MDKRSAASFIQARPVQRVYGQPEPEGWTPGWGTAAGLGALAGGLGLAYYNMPGENWDQKMNWLGGYWNAFNNGGLGGVAQHWARQNPEQANAMAGEWAANNPQEVKRIGYRHVQDNPEDREAIARMMAQKTREAAENQYGAWNPKRYLSRWLTPSEDELTKQFDTGIKEMADKELQTKQGCLRVAYMEKCAFFTGQQDGGSHGAAPTEYYKDKDGEFHKYNPFAHWITQPRPTHFDYGDGKGPVTPGERFAPIFQQWLQQQTGSQPAQQPQQPANTPQAQQPQAQPQQQGTTAPIDTSKLPQLVPNPEYRPITGPFAQGPWSDPYVWQNPDGSVEYPYQRMQQLMQRMRNAPRKPVEFDPRWVQTGLTDRLAK